jgi:hypothetical protein
VIIKCKTNSTLKRVSALLPRICTSITQPVAELASREPAGQRDVGITDLVPAFVVDNNIDFQSVWRALLRNIEDPPGYRIARSSEHTDPGHHIYEISTDWRLWESVEPKFVIAEKLKIGLEKTAEQSDYEHPYNESFRITVDSTVMMRGRSSRSWGKIEQTDTLLLGGTTNPDLSDHQMIVRFAHALEKSSK